MPLSTRLYRFADIIGDVSNLVKLKGYALVEGIGTLVDRFAPGFGAIIGAVGGLFGELFGKKKSIVVEKIIEPIRVAPQSLSYGLGANPASAIFGGRAVASGAGHITIDFKNGAQDLVTAWVTDGLLDESNMEGAFS